MQIRSGRRHFPKRIVLRVPQSAAIGRPGDVVDRPSRGRQPVNTGPVLPHEREVSIRGGINYRFTVGGPGSRRSRNRREVSKRSSETSHAPKVEIISFLHEDGGPVGRYVQEPDPRHRHWYLHTISTRDSYLASGG